MHTKYIIIIIIFPTFVDQPEIINYLVDVYIIISSREAYSKPSHTILRVRLNNITAAHVRLTLVTISHTVHSMSHGYLTSQINQYCDALCIHCTGYSRYVISKSYRFISVFRQMAGNQRNIYFILILL